MQNDDVQTNPTDDGIEDAVVVEETEVLTVEPAEESGSTDTETTSRALSPDEPASPAETLIHLEQMINGYLTDIARTREKLKSQKEMFKQTFEQDKDYNEVSEEQKAVKRKHNEVKQKIAKTDSVTAVKMTIDEIQSEMKDLQQSLSDYLHRYIQLTQATSFTGPGGEVLTIVRTAKLVKKKD
ncbi:hypothetical protein HYS00_01200 [Candidatus Microgenomates bacterium]|nr:hypothetical protein [Candidatus Microgenomates bacterium]